MDEEKMDEATKRLFEEVEGMTYAEIKLYKDIPRGVFVSQSPPQTKEERKKNNASLIDVVMDISNRDLSDGFTEEELPEGFLDEFRKKYNLDEK